MTWTPTHLILNVSSTTNSVVDRPVLPPSREIVHHNAQLLLMTCFVVTVALQRLLTPLMSGEAAPGRGSTKANESSWIVCQPDPSGPVIL